MSHPPSSLLPAWTLAAPVLSGAILLGALIAAPTAWLLVLVGVALIVAVLTAVHHAEVVAHWVGEPFGTLILALAVTVIEAALVVSMMLSGGAGAATVVRDTVYAAVMIVCNGMVGLCLLAGGVRHHVLHFRIDATGPTLSVLAALAVLTLVLPSFTTTTPDATFSPSQLAFAGVVSLVLYCAFVFVQTVRHRDYFLPVETDARDAHVAPPPRRIGWTGFALLVVCLVVVVGLAKTLAPAIRAGVEAAGAPVGVVGIIIALLVLLPETWAAVRAALRNRMQVSLNLALGSGLATIGLTIPVVATLSVPLGISLTLGLPPKETVLLALTLLVSAITLGSGRATVLQGAVHLVLFAAFLFLAVVP
jgi:Ca2+:H+ antiporter